MLPRSLNALLARAGLVLCSCIASAAFHGAGLAMVPALAAVCSTASPGLLRSAGPLVALLAPLALHMAGTAALTGVTVAALRRLAPRVKRWLASEQDHGLGRITLAGRGAGPRRPASERAQCRGPNPGRR
jgi:hypothetical protein